ncbi:CDP-glycerol glycerophosphotransferase family protein [Allobacillus sp. SKP2-8]|uniref:CDP-glycerol glycerophosphotransferase family protein n=1 Tax=unclassified Allobacillus TaxID=2628859 RepID=UPI00118464F2|nr:CDP-glycerol glycerophosphotransferase family protein [Allobacillus sp. SKP2-8]TSJ65253.1 CDP-glycerol glycerophosphotransferase family protein [Allobacillus sp. SKP2-8]
MNILEKIRNHKKYQKFYRKLFNKIEKKVPKKSKTIVFESFSGKQYSDNPRAIFEYMNQYYPNYNLIWSINPSCTRLFKKEGINFIKRGTLKWLWVMARASFWVVNTRLPGWIYKSKRTNYIQTWHGTPLKKLAMDMDNVTIPGITTEQYKRSFKKETSEWNALVAPNEYSSKIFRKAFNFNGDMIHSGYPRNDFLKNHDSEDIEKIKESMKIPKDKKVILYAPTWRDNTSKVEGKHQFVSDLNFDLLNTELGNEYIVLVRMHYLAAANIDFNKYKSFLVDVTDYNDIRDLYIISDILITDYSSVFFDFSIMNKPIIFYVHDLEEYQNEIRGFYFDFINDAPGPLVKTTEQTIATIKNIDDIQREYNQKYNEFNSKFNHWEDGKASERVVDYILNY